MSTSFDGLRDIKLVQSQNKGWIDRQKSLKMVRLAQMSLNKKRLATSSEKHDLSSQQLIQDRKDRIIHQIRDKLSHIQTAQLNLQHTAKQTQNNISNVFRLERLLENIKRERNSTFEPKIIHRRQVVNQRNGNRSDSRRNPNLQQLLKEVTEAREQVKYIKKINKGILGADRQFNLSQHRNRLNSEDQGFSTVQRTKDYHKYGWKGAYNTQKQQQNPNYLIENRQIISTSSLLLQPDNNSKHHHQSRFVQHNNPPSEVIYSWTLQKEGKPKNLSESFTVFPLQSWQKK